MVRTTYPIAFILHIFCLTHFEINKHIHIMLIEKIDTDISIFLSWFIIDSPYINVISLIKFKVQSYFEPIFYLDSTRLGNVIPSTSK